MRKENHNAITRGSMADMAQQAGGSLAESFLSVDHIILIDSSGSMRARDADGGGKSRWDAALESLRRLQKTLPGKIAVFVFSDDYEFVPGGIPRMLGGGTQLVRALEFVRVADGLVEFWVISDGQAWDPTSCLRLASGFHSKINGVYVGPDGGGGQEFLRKLSLRAGGKFAKSAAPGSFHVEVQNLLAEGA